MKRTLSLLLLALSCLSAQPLPPAVIPAPVRMEVRDGSVSLTASSAITYSAAEANETALQCAEELNRATGFGLEPSKGKNGTIHFQLNERPDKNLGAEGYTLESGNGRIVIAANAPAGLFYGMQTLLQLLPPEVRSDTVVRRDWSVPAVRITDAPRFGWRGMMLDVSRHFFSVDDVKRYIDEMARYKYNTFHWHLTDDHGWRIEIKSLPRLTEVGAWRVERFGEFGRRQGPKPGEPATVGGFYTQEQVRDIVAYAQKRHVTIVPEIDMPGHSMAAIAAYPELSVTKDTTIRVNPGTKFAEWFGNGTFKMYIDNTLNPSDERVYDFIDKVMTELVPLFPGPYIHAGGDECYKGYWKQDPGCRALMKKLNIRHVEDLQGYFMGRVEKILKSKGKKMIGWDEIMEGGVSPSATVMSWRGIWTGVEAAAAGHDVVMAPASHVYIDYNQGDQTVDPPVYASLRMKKAYSFEPVPDGTDPARILGGQANLWAENVPHLRAAQYLAYPRAWALSEVFWSPKGSKDWYGFTQRLERHFLRADAAGVTASRAVFDPVVRTIAAGERLRIVMESEFPALDLHYTIDDTMPDERSPRYTDSFLLPEGPVTVRVRAYRDGRPVGNLVTLKPDELRNRAGK
ncbi:MAG: family 20 glycosylhydrolase [Bacteroidetes bacterium]|nr:MAG: family 20 glycosylhydrolase [Bacteroidota bacterium]